MEGVVVDGTDEGGGFLRVVGGSGGGLIAKGGVDG
jgi:hypothetical protein